MDCNNSTKKIKTINQQTGVIGVSQADIEKTKNRMRLFLGLIDGVLKDKGYRHLRGKKYACVENLIMQQGRFFEFEQENIFCSDPFKNLLDLALKNHMGYCEGFVLPYKGGIPVIHGWVFDKVNNKIISSDGGLHYGIAFNPDFALSRFQETGIASIFTSDIRCKISILASGFPIDSLFI